MVLNQGCRVMVAVSVRHKEFVDLFTRDPLEQWTTVFADDLSKARCSLQHNPCDVLIVHEELLEKEGPQALGWLAWKQNFPVVFLGDMPENFSRAYEIGVTTCLARDMAMAHPPLLDFTMRSALTMHQTKAALERTKEQLSQTRSHIDRLVTLLCRTGLQPNDHLWYPQPYMMERLQEEIARAERHKIPLSLAIGELQSDDEVPSEETPALLPDWSTDLIVREKRRCDVAGQYGPQNFMLLMVQTPKHGGMTCLKRLQQVIEHPPEKARWPHVRAFFGLTTMIGERLQPQTLLRNAEQNLEVARAETKLRIVAD